jgi:hypothetical protein
MKHSILLKVALVLLPIGTVAFAWSQITVPQTTPNPVSLRVLATQSGNYVSYAQPSMFPKYLDVNQLTAASTDVVIATAGDNICKLSADETFITTDFQVTVESVIRGSLAVGNNITVKIPGGRTAFTVPCGNPPCLNPAIAEIRVPWFKKLIQGKQYYLFLVGASKYAGQAVLTFYPTAGPQGVFEISNGAVTSNSGRLRDPMWQYNNMSSSAFSVRVGEANQTAPLPNPSPQLPQP